MAEARAVLSAHALRLDATLLAIGAFEHVLDRYVEPRAP